MSIRFDLLARLVEEQTPQMGRMDANETAAFTRQLEYIYAAPFNVEYAESMFRKILPVDSSVPSWADTFTYRSFDKRGEAAFLTNYATNDFPSADVQGREFTQKIKPLGTMYSYNLRELRQAAKLNIQLSAERAQAARDVIERKLDLTAAVGDTATGLFGCPGGTVTSNVVAGTLINTVANPTATAIWNATPGGGNHSATALECVTAVNAMCSKIVVTTKGVWVPDTLVLDTASYDYAASTPVAITFASDLTILQYILKQNPYLKTIERWSRLDTAGASAKARVMAYPKNPKVLTFVMAQEFEQSAPQVEGLQYNTYCTAATGGVQVKYPDAICAMDGLQP